MNGSAVVVSFDGDGYTTDLRLLSVMSDEQVENLAEVLRHTRDAALAILADRRRGVATPSRP